MPERGADGLYSRFSGVLRPSADGALSLRATVCAFLAYGLAHSAVSLLSGPALAMDDAKLNLVAQSFQLGYFPTNPPLYEWLLFLTQKLAGPRLESFLLVKYLLLTAAGAFTYLAGREVFRSRLWAALCALSLTLLFQIGWNYHQAFTHSAALIAATAFFWFRVFVLLRAPTLASYALLGLAAGLGLMSKYSFAGAAAAFLVAALWRPETRGAILSPRMGLALLVCALVVSPHAYWLVTQAAPVAEAAAHHLAGSERPYVMRVLSGLPSTIWAVVAFFLPFAIVVAAVFAGRIAWREPLSVPARLAGEAGLAGAGLLILGVLLFGMETMQERYALAFLYPVPFAVLAMMRAGAPERSRIALYAGLSAGFIAFVAAARLAEAVFPGPPFCSACRQWTPYDAIAATLDAQGFDGKGTLVGFDDNTAGNLRRLYPGARALSSHQPGYAPPRRDPPGECYFIWSPQMGPNPPGEFLTLLNRLRSTEASGTTRPLGGERRTITWSVTAIPPDSALYESVCRISPRSQ